MSKYVSKFTNLLIKRFIFIILIIFGFNSISYSEETEVIQTYDLRNGGIIEVICLRGYEFILICERKRGECSINTDQIPNIEQIITEQGGGKKC